MDDIFDLTMLLLDYMNDENIEEIKKIGEMLTITEQKIAIFILFDLPYYISDTEYAAYSDVAKYLYFHQAKHSNKICLESSGFNKKLKQEVSRWVAVAKAFSKKRIPDMGNVLYVKDESGNNVAYCYKENGKMVLHINGMG